MMKNKRKLLLLIATVLMFVLLVACDKKSNQVRGDGNDSATSNEVSNDATTEVQSDNANDGTEAEEPVVVRLGCTSTDGSALNSSMLNIAINQGFMEEELAKVNAVAEYYPITGGGPATNEALAGKSIDFGIMGSFAATNGYDSGIETSVIGIDGSTGGAIMTKQESGIASIADLKGKKIGVTLGTSWEEILEISLNKSGLSKADVEIVNLSLSDTYEALLLDQVDAIVGYLGMLGDDITLAQTGEIVILADSRTDSDITICGYHLVDKNFEEAHPEIVQAYVNALYRATAYGEEHPELFRDIYSNVTDEVYEWQYADYLFLVTGTALDEAAVAYGKKDTEFMYNNGLILSEVDVDVWFNTSYYENAKANIN